MNEKQRLGKLLRNCTKNLLFDQGIQIHAAVVKMGFGLDLVLSKDLIDMYAKFSRVASAHAMFDTMRERNVVSWTALMCGYLKQSNPRAAISLFSQMVSYGFKPNEFTFSINFKACGLVPTLENGVQIHDLCTKSGFDAYLEVGNSIIDMYSKCERIQEATLMFDRMPLKNLISWNSIIAGYTNQGKASVSVALFKKMQKHGEIPDEFTYTSTLKACSGLGEIKVGTQIHASLIGRGFSWSVHTTTAGALVNFYAKSGYLYEAHEVFNLVENKNVILWTTLILGYAQEAKLSEAMELFRQLRENDIQVDGFVLSNMVDVFADFALIEQGKQMHSYSIKVPYGLDILVANSITDMYFKCGLIEQAERAFTEISMKNVVSWTVMITGYGKHGLGREAINLFNKMLLNNVEPDEVTYLAVLSACSHSGLVKECQEYFSRLNQDQRITPKIEHYACMVDLLGRAGRLKEAKNLIDNMLLKPNVGIWQTLLSACRMHGDLEVGREVGKILFRLDGDNPVNYVMMSNIYAEARNWKECERIRGLVKVKGLKKEAGCSWVEIDKRVHCFYGGDDTHPLMRNIIEVLKEMERKMKEELGYSYCVRFALHDVEEESKEENLRVHSEKLAIGFALVSGGMKKGGGVIRIFKNLRVCGDCHEFIKALSKVLEIVFVIRDANRFHKFENGLCSCGDYW